MTTELERSIAARLGRRDLLKIGGLTVSLAAIVAACGDDRSGSTDPGRIGLAPPITEPPAYPVDDAVLFRTGSSIEQTTIMLYEAILDLGVLDEAGTTLVGQLLENHKELDRVMGELTVAAGGEVWPCTNPWFDERYLVPITDAIKASDNQVRDIYNVAVSFENLGAATYQQYSIQVTEPEQRLAVVKAAAQDSRNSAVLVIAAEGSDGYVSPALLRPRGGHRRRWRPAAVRRPVALRVGRPVRADRRPSERGGHPRVLRPPDAVAQQLHLQRARTRLLTVRPRSRELSCALSAQTCSRIAWSCRRLDTDGEVAGWPRRCVLQRRGKSGLHRAGCWREPGRGDLTDVQQRETADGPGAAR